MEDNIKFDCPQCGNSFLATPQDYITASTFNGVVIKEGYCPVCGTAVRTNTNNSF